MKKEIWFIVGSCLFIGSSYANTITHSKNLSANTPDKNQTTTAEQDAMQFDSLPANQQLGLGYNLKDLQRTINICNSVASITIPTSDMQSPSEMKYYQNAKLDDYYLLVSKDWVNYRKELIVGNDDGSNNYPIAEIYANGWGVKRNPLLAIALICKTKGDHYENIQMIDDLNKTKDLQRLKSKFSYCDYANGNNAFGCDQEQQSIDQETADYNRDQKFTHAIKNWSVAQKAAFNALKLAAENFISEHANSEQDLSGTARDQIVIGEEEQLQDQFSHELKSFETSKMPKDVDFTKADKALNVMYARVMQGVKKLPSEDLGLTQTPDGIRKTQLKWLKYRDAWVAFAKVRYPNTAPNVFATWITKQRNAQLNELLTTDFACCYDLSG